MVGAIAGAIAAFPGPLIKRVLSALCAHAAALAEYEGKALELQMDLQHARKALDEESAVHKKLVKGAVATCAAAVHVCVQEVGVVLLHALALQMPTHRSRLPTLRSRRATSCASRYM